MRTTARSQQPAARASRDLVGKTVSGIITRPGPGQREKLLVLQFTDGSCFEFVSPAAQRALKNVSRQVATDGPATREQLSFFPLDGNQTAASAPVF
ncbi:MAG: hypothetical protein AAGA23_10095 [Pseudomonadota bacterium]